MQEYAVNKYLHTVASVGFLFTLNYDARNHELKISLNTLNKHELFQFNGLHPVVSNDHHIGKNYSI